MSGPEKQPGFISDALDYIEKQRREISSLEGKVEKMRAEIAVLSRTNPSGYGIQLSSLYGVPFDCFLAFIRDIETKTADQANTLLAEAFEMRILLRGAARALDANPANTLSTARMHELTQIAPPAWTKEIV